MVRRKYVTEKSSDAPGTVRLEALHLNHYTTPGPKPEYKVKVFLHQGNVISLLLLLLFIQCVFLQSIYYSTNAIYDTPFMSHINSNMFGTEVPCLGSHYNKSSVPFYKNDYNLRMLKYKTKLAYWLICTFVIMRVLLFLMYSSESFSVGCSEVNISASFMV